MISNMSTLSMYKWMPPLVAEQLTASRWIYGIHGQCGLGILSEFFPHGDMEHVILPGDGYMEAHKLYDGYKVKPQNNLTGIEKLEISTQLAEAVAYLHGNSGGVAHRPSRYAACAVAVDSP
jgi:hypothetical protein